MNADRYIAFLWNEQDPLALKTKLLLYKVLERAILDITLPCRSPSGGSIISRKDKEAAVEWLFEPIEEKASDWSFTWICEHLDLDPLALQLQIKNDYKNGKVFSKIASYASNQLIYSIFDENFFDWGEFEVTRRVA